MGGRPSDCTPSSRGCSGLQSDATPASCLSCAAARKLQHCQFRTKSRVAEFASRLEDSGCSEISVTVDIYVVSHRERSMHNGRVRSWCRLNGIPRNTKGELV
jgi:isopentenyl diphosphate isomerase/L-lactate dehydrogenase-like FMN-dependent dehydrogenase